jgi:hypothetical protein
MSTDADWTATLQQIEEGLGRELLNAIANVQDKQRTPLAIVADPTMVEFLKKYPSTDMFKSAGNKNVHGYIGTWMGLAVLARPYDDNGYDIVS